jgi:hypothetical protein
MVTKGGRAIQSNQIQSDEVRCAALAVSAATILGELSSLAPDLPASGDMDVAPLAGAVVKATDDVVR